MKKALSLILVFSLVFSLFATPFSAAELSAKAGGYGICDYCNTPAEKGYYIAVLNQWYCPKCYDEFCKRAKYYQEDTGTEKRNYELYSKLFGV